MRERQVQRMPRKDLIVNWIKRPAEKANGRDKRGSTSRPSIFVVTVLTPATTETEDSPAVSSCPTIYIATRVPCKMVPSQKPRAKYFLFVHSKSLTAPLKILLTRWL